VASATVLFSDFIGFTEVAATLSPEALVQQLERCFGAFDDIVDRCGITKLKTIGDGYMAVGGLPVPDDEHAIRVVQAALAMAEWVVRPQDNQPPPPLRLRIGVHTGPLVAGVIGKRRILYDVWGDTVNVAARLQETGAPGRVNISQATRDQIGDGFRVQPRGLVPVKGKGALPMYFVESHLVGSH
jgi:histidine kinase